MVQEQGVGSGMKTLVVDIYMYFMYIYIYELLLNVSQFFHFVCNAILKISCLLHIIS